jgi:hypothetical protein
MRRRIGAAFGRLFARMPRIALLASSLLAALLVATSTVGRTAPATALQRAIVESARLNAAYAFEIEHTFEGETLRARFTPETRPRLRLVSPASLAQLSEQQRTDFDYLVQSVDGVPWCASQPLRHVRDVRLVREDDRVAVYAFQPTAESVTGQQTREVVNHLRGEITIVKAAQDVSHVRLYAPRPFRPAPIARVESYTITITCASAPNGRYYVAEQTRRVRASSFGRPFNVDVVRRNRIVLAE